jgi:hypothetical protein
MHRTIFHKIFFVLLSIAMSIYVFLALFPTGQSYALTESNKKPALTLNRSQGPLGLTLTLRGKNFPPGQANLSYIDAHNVPGIFSPPGDTAVAVLSSGAFLTTNLIMPASGPVGAWKIVITDSQGGINTIRYSVLARHGQTSAGPPTLILTLPNGVSSATSTPSITATASATAEESATPTDAVTPTATSSSVSSTGSIAFTGSNWLPKGTAVKLVLFSGATTLPLLEPATVSKADGTISGTFFMPANLRVSTATVIASDVTTGALRAQVPIAIANGTVSFLPGLTPQPAPNNTPLTSDAGTPAVSNNGPGTFTNPLGTLDAAIWGPVLLVAGGMLAIAGLMLILFMIPWSRNGNRKGHHTRSGQF